MTAATGPRSLGASDTSPVQFPVLPAALPVYAGWMMGRFPEYSANAGYVANIGYDPDLQCLGVNRTTRDTSISPTPDVFIDEGIFPMFANTGTPDTSWERQPCYGVDNQTFSMSSNGGAYPLIGIVWSVYDSTFNADLTSTECMVCVGPHGISLAQSVLSSGAQTARAVITSIAAYTNSGGVITASANGAIGAQDGITLAVGNIVFLPLVQSGAASVAASDTGPWIVTSVGSASTLFTLERPTWWITGNTVVPAFDIKVGAEGTKWAGNMWRAFPVSGSKVIDTDDPHFWPMTDAQTLTQGTGVTNLWLRDTKRVAATNTKAANAFWLSTLTAGAGTGAITITGTSADTYSVVCVNF